VGREPNHPSTSASPSRFPKSRGVAARPPGA
jgi:hypothetical protein